MIGGILGRLFFGAGRFVKPRKYNIHFHQRQDVEIDRVDSINVLSIVTNIVTSRDNCVIVGDRQSIKMLERVQIRSKDSQLLNIKSKNAIIAKNRQVLSVDKQCLEVSTTKNTLEVKE